MNRTSSILLWFGLIIATSLALYHTSDRVHELNEQLHQIQQAIDAERESLHVLKADWVYLANPDRVEKISKRHLPLRPSSPQQIASLYEVQNLLPTRNEAMANVAISSTPLANVRTSLAALAPRPAQHYKHNTMVASNNTGHISDHMIMQRTASAEPLPDSIGALINEIGSHP